MPFRGERTRDSYTGATPLALVYSPPYAGGMEGLTEQVRADLTTAMRARDRTTVGVLRTVLAAIANAEAQPDTDATPTSLRSEGGIAGATAGFGAAEVARRDLTEVDTLAVLTAERDERLASADALGARGAIEAADDLRAEAAVIDRYLA
jgi:uncharacterized protein